MPLLDRVQLRTLAILRPILLLPSAQQPPLHQLVIIAHLYPLNPHHSPLRPQHQTPATTRQKPLQNPTSSLPPSAKPSTISSSSPTRTPRTPTPPKATPPNGTPSKRNSSPSGSRSDQRKKHRFSSSWVDGQVASPAGMPTGGSRLAARRETERGKSLADTWMRRKRARLASGRMESGDR